MEGKKDDEVVKEVEEQEDPKPSAVPSAGTTSAKSVAKNTAVSQDTTRSPAPPDASDTVSRAPEEEVPSEKVFTPQSPPGQAVDYLAGSGPTSVGTPSSTAVHEPPGSEGKTPSATQLSESSRKFQGQASKTRAVSEGPRGSGADKIKVDQDLLEDFPSEVAPKKRAPGPTGFVGCLASGLPNFENFSCSKIIAKRNPFVHNPPRPEERRPRVERPRSPRDYIINLREDLADFQETHGLPRSRDYSFMSLGLALAQETARAICSVFLMFSELFPVIAIISLVLRFALDKLIDILETHEPVPKLKKTLIFCLQMVMILIPLWILIGTIVLPLAGLLFSIFRKLLRFKGGKTGRVCSSYSKKQVNPSGPKKIDATKAKASCAGSSG